jgi:hypothetical protein
MTEPEWLAATDARPMVDFLGSKTDARKVRLFAVACGRRLADRFPHPSCAAAVEVAEQYADGGASVIDLSEAGAAADEYFGSTCVYGTSTGNQVSRTAVATCLGTANELVYYHHLAFRYFGPDTHAANADFLRDVIGNPFRPAAVEAAWRTSTVLGLCRQMYESRDFGAMPILADALQDAGCDSDDVLNHCRGEGGHVRGCWVVDLLSGRTG